MGAVCHARTLIVCSVMCTALFTTSVDLSNLSVNPEWGGWGSNPRPKDYESHSGVQSGAWNPVKPQVRCLCTVLGYAVQYGRLVCFLVCKECMMERKRPAPADTGRGMADHEGVDMAKNSEPSGWGAPRIPVRDRIIAQTSIDPETGCWNWLCAASPQGYGRMMVTREHKVHRSTLVHRAAYEEWVGPIPDGLVIDHLCRNTMCCNPAHLEPVTQTENVLRGESPSNYFRVATHCIHGHEFTPENTYLDKRGRYCRACRKRRNAESIARKKVRA